MRTHILGDSIYNNSKKILSYGDTHVYGAGGNRPGFEEDARRYADVTKRAVDRCGFKKILEKKPIDIFFGEEHHFEKFASYDVPSRSLEGVNGYYEGASRTLGIKDPDRLTRAALNTRAMQAPGPKLAYASSMSSMGNPTADEKMERVLAHELAHHFHQQVQANRNDDKRSQRLSKHSKAVSMYAWSNEFEWFAETHTAYIYEREHLKATHPEAHDFMKEMRQKHGLEA
jgi:hypothetical protein